MTSQNPPQKKQGSKLPLIAIIVVVGGCVGISVLGILAAIAIPAFLRYINLSKAAEAQAVVMRVVDESEMHFVEHCTFPPELPPLFDVNACCGGEKCEPDAAATQVWIEAGITPPTEPTYFSYHTEEVADSEYMVRGVANFTCSPDFNHTFEIGLEGVESNGECTVQRYPAVTMYEFE